jgi:predicted HAD superfamily Cof-like phosphohydrolase
MNDLVADVEKFHKKFKQAYVGPPRHLPHRLATFRLDFMKEELAEYEVALESGDAEKQADALVDLVYVTLGTASLSGFNFREGWDRVQVKNMLKEPVAKHPERSVRGTEFDVVKPPGWTPPDLSDLVPAGLTHLKVAGALDRVRDILLGHLENDAALNFVKMEAEITEIEGPIVQGIKLALDEKGLVLRAEIDFGYNHVYQLDLICQLPNKRTSSTLIRRAA